MSDRFVYLKDGTKCRVVTPDDGSGIVVYTQVSGVDLGCSGCEDMVDGKLLLIQPDDVFDNPPVKVIDEQLKLKRIELEALSVRLLNMKVGAAKVKYDYEAAMAMYANYSGVLARLDDFINGRVTHFLLFNHHNQPRIVSIEELVKDKYDAKWGKVLSLTITKWPDLTWTLDGVVMSKECIPCVSYVDAQKVGQHWVGEQIAACVYRRYIVLFAIKYDLLVPAGYIRAVVNLERQELDECEAKDREAVTRVRLAKEHEWKDLLN